MFFASINQEVAYDNTVVPDTEIFPNNRQWAAAVRNKHCILLAKVRYAMAISLNYLDKFLSDFL